jgi:replication initiation protein RepC
VAVAKAEAKRHPLNNNPKEKENWPHITSTNHLLNLKDTLIASTEGSPSQVSTGKGLRSREVKSHVGNDQTTSTLQRPGKVRTDSGSLLKITPVELIKLAPRLKQYLNSKAPSWPEIVDAADWLRDEMGISKFIWGEACLTMGREKAAIAVAIVSAKPSAHFRGSPGGYFHGMVSKAKAGELHLARTIWGMRGFGERQLK